MNVFTNKKEQRLRAGWRLLLQFFTLIVFIAPLYFPFFLLLPASSPLTAVIPQFLGVIASIWIAAQYIDNRNFVDYGIYINKQWITEFIVGTVLAFLAIGAIFFVQWQLGWITISDFGWNLPSEQPFFLNLLVFFLAMAMVGFYEELFSRGYQILNIVEGLRYPWLNKRLIVFIAIFLTSSVFGLLHYNNPNASVLSTCNIVIAGFVLAIPFIFTGRLSLSAGLHFGWNFFMAGLFGFPVSGKQFDVGILNIQQSGPDLWTGGNFGPEAGLLVLLGMAIMLGGVCVYLRTKGCDLSIHPLLINRYKVPGKSGEQAQ
ncbi:CPBP family intramembrane glutamic endopeptidase [Fodinibius halophilus]|uniref:CPBP family intramembrane metalloprotease n=1 Tax=Fodinibius halophilus TaxID=1736908 RepID=A0A6M1T1Z4_9BACT|nr:type II CAAX endopeptidase family protein [Fodinibius halophilus]NGP87235.1 CPBP family intramembrane metalloprotease [Fodinibius halophilus]